METIGKLQTKTGILLRLQFCSMANHVTKRLKIYDELRMINRNAPRFKDEDYLTDMQATIDRGARTGLDVIDNSNRLVATIFTGLENRGTTGIIDLVWTDRSIRREGVATLLTRRALDDMRRQGARSGETWISESNGPARSFFKRQGWQATNIVVGEDTDYRKYTFNLGQPLIQLV